MSGYIVLMDRVVSASMGLRYVRDTMPGDDLGQLATAVCLCELYAALDALKASGYAQAFDYEAYVGELLARGKEK